MQGLYREATTYGAPLPKRKSLFEALFFRRSLVGLRFPQGTASDFFVHRHSVPRFPLSRFAVAVLERDPACFHFQQAPVADGDAKDIRRRILQRPSTVADRLTVYDPILPPYFRRRLRVDIGFLPQRIAEFCAKDFRQGNDRRQDVPRTGRHCVPSFDMSPPATIRCRWGWQAGSSVHVCGTLRKPSRPPTYFGSRAGFRKAAAAVRKNRNPRQEVRQQTAGQVRSTRADAGSTPVSGIVGPAADPRWSRSKIEFPSRLQSPFRLSCRAVSKPTSTRGV
jgi:hypothetical protein